MIDGCTVFVVDDDRSVREAMQDLLMSMGIKVVVYESAREYVAQASVDTIACLVLDVHLPDINGLDLQQALSSAHHPPIVFISGRGDIPTTVKAMKAGAIDFLPKPFSQEQLLTAIDAALRKHRDILARQVEIAGLLAREASLTPREREVFRLVVSGMLNKQAASALGISEVTLQIHRGNVMRKMEARSFAELVHVAVRLGVLGTEGHGLLRSHSQVPG